MSRHGIRHLNSEPAHERKPQALDRRVTGGSPVPRALCRGPARHPLFGKRSNRAPRLVRRTSSRVMGFCFIRSFYAGPIFSKANQRSTP